MFALIKQLTELFGPVGREERVAHYLQERWRPHCQWVEITPVGNVIAHVGGSGPKVMLTAHMDEICLYVKSITAEGFALVTHCHRGAGSYHLRDAMNWEFEVLTEGGELLPAVLAGRTGHLRFGHDAQQRPPEWRDVFLDFGFQSREQLAEAGIRIGAPGVWRAHTRQLGTRLVGKAMDDRIGLALMSACLEALHPAQLSCELYLAATVMEEFGLVGAASVPAAVPGLELCVALEVGLAGDVPGVGLDEVPVRLGGGPMVASRDGMVHYTPGATTQLWAAARRAGVTCQPILVGYGTDGHEFIRQGVPTCLLAPPTRYTHTPIEMVDQRDVEGCLEVLKSLLVTGSTRAHQPG